MSLLLHLRLEQSSNFSSIIIETPASFSPSSTSSVFANPTSRFGKKFGCFNSRCFDGLRLHTLPIVERRNYVICDASIDDDGGGLDTPYVLSESEDENGEDLALDSKLQLKLERNMRMKFSKKIRMRRKKLGRKRLLRKKGTWPPSKLKKKVHDPVQASHDNLCGVVAAAVPEPETKKRKLRGIMKPRPVSPEMQALVRVPEIARTQATKLIWTYIKENSLQDPENKKIIICDEKLKKIFKGNERVGFLEVAGLISPHFL